MQQSTKWETIGSVSGSRRMLSHLCPTDTIRFVILGEFVKEIFVKEFDKITEVVQKPKKKGNVKEKSFNTLW